MAKVLNASQEVQKPHWLDAFGESVLWTLGTLLIALLVSIYSKLHTRQYHYFQILSPFSLIFFYLNLDFLLGDLLSFNLPGENSYFILKFLLNHLLAFWLIYSLGKTLFKGIEARQWALISSGLIFLSIIVTRVFDLYWSSKKNGYEFRGTLAYPLGEIKTSSFQELLLQVEAHP